MDEEKIEKKIPWFFSAWFIIVLYVTTWWLFFIPAIIMNILRIVKYDKKKVPSIILGIVGILVVFVLYVTISDINNEKKYNSYLASGEYEKAIEYVNGLSQSSEGTFLKYAEIYAAQGNYDESVDKLLEYAKSNDLINLSEKFIDKLAEYAEKASDEKQKLADNLISDYKVAIEEKEKTEAEKKAKEEEAKKKEKEEKEAKEKAEAEAKAEKEAKEKAQKEAEADKQKYGITKDEFVDILYSSPDIGVLTDEEIDEFYEDWKNDSQHWGWKKDSSGNWKLPVTKDDISNQAVSFSYKDVMRNPSQYEGVYVAKKFYIDSKVSGTGNCYRAYSLNDVGLPDYNTHFVIIDKRSDDMKILDGDMGVVYGVFLGVNDTDYSQTNVFTDKQTQLEVPEIEMLYFTLTSE